MKILVRKQHAPLEFISDYTKFFRPVYQVGWFVEAGLVGVSTFDRVLAPPRKRGGFFFFTHAPHNHNILLLIVMTTDQYGKKFIAVCILVNVIHI